MADPTYGEVSGGLRLDRLADVLMDAIELQFREADVPLPERRYVAAGGPREVAYDCEQLTVALSGIGWGAASDRSPGSQQLGSPMSALALRHAVYAIALVRAHPTRNDDLPRGENEPPTAEQLDAAGRRHVRDAGLLSQALVRMSSRVPTIETVQQVGQMIAGPGVLVLPGLVESLGPSGGYVSAETSFTVTAAEVG